MQNWNLEEIIKGRGGVRENKIAFLYAGTFHAEGQLCRKRRWKDSWKMSPEVSTEMVYFPPHPQPIITHLLSYINRIYSICKWSKGCKTVTDQHCLLQILSAFLSSKQYEITLKENRFRPATLNTKAVLQNGWEKQLPMNSCWTHSN